MQNLSVTEYKGVRVLTTKQLAEAYDTTSDVIGYNFRYNKNRYIEEKHYIMLEKQALRDYKVTNVEIQRSLPKISKLYLWTEKGALLHAKSLNTVKAWEVYDYLVDFYFRVKENEEQKNHIVPAQRKHLVVNVPENKEAQELISEMRKYLSGMDALLDLYCMYHNEEEFSKIAYAVDSMGGKISRTALFMYGFKPKLVEKYL